MLYLLWFTWHHRIFRSSFPRHWAMPKYVFPGQRSKNGYGERRSGMTHTSSTKTAEEMPDFWKQKDQIFQIITWPFPRCWKWVFPDRLGERFWTLLSSSKAMCRNGWGFRRKASRMQNPRAPGLLGFILHLKRATHLPILLCFIGIKLDGYIFGCVLNGQDLGNF